MQAVVNGGINLAFDMFVGYVFKCVKGNLKVKIVPFAFFVGNEEIGVSETAFVIFCAVHCRVAVMKMVNRCFNIKIQHIARLVNSEQNLSSVGQRITVGSARNKLSVASDERLTADRKLGSDFTAVHIIGNSYACLEEMSRIV